MSPDFWLGFATCLAVVACVLTVVCILALAAVRMAGLCSQAERERRVK